MTRVEARSVLAIDASPHMVTEKIRLVLTAFRFLQVSRKRELP